MKIGFSIRNIKVKLLDFVSLKNRHRIYKKIKYKFNWIFSLTNVTSRSLVTLTSELEHSLRLSHSLMPSCMFESQVICDLLN